MKHIIVVAAAIIWISLLPCEIFARELPRPITRAPISQKTARRMPTATKRVQASPYQSTSPIAGRASVECKHRVFSSKKLYEGDNQTLGYKEWDNATLGQGIYRKDWGGAPQGAKRLPTPMDLYGW